MTMRVAGSSTSRRCKLVQADTVSAVMLAGTFDEARLRRYRELGITRFSVGVQVCVNGVLATM